VKYKDKPLEFWDLKTLTFLREMVSNPPSFNCIEWSPTPHKSKNKSDHPHLGTAMTTVDFDLAMGATDSKMAQVKREGRDWKGREGRERREGEEWGWREGGRGRLEGKGE
jgi:hypothetical protein